MITRLIVFAFALILPLAAGYSKPVKPEAISAHCKHDTVIAVHSLCSVMEYDIVAELQAERGFKREARSFVKEGKDYPSFPIVRACRVQRFTRADCSNVLVCFRLNTMHRNATHSVAFPVLITDPPFC